MRECERVCERGSKRVRECEIVCDTARHIVLKSLRERERVCVCVRVCERVCERGRKCVREGERV